MNNSIGRKLHQLPFSSVITSGLIIILVGLSIVSIFLLAVFNNDNCLIADFEFDNCEIIEVSVGKEISFPAGDLTVYFKVTNGGDDSYRITQDVSGSITVELVTNPADDLSGSYQHILSDGEGVYFGIDLLNISPEVAKFQIGWWKLSEGRSAPIY